MRTQPALLGRYPSPGILVLVALALAPTGCRGDSPTARPEPQIGQLSPLGGDGEHGGAIGSDRTEGGAVPTWTPTYPGSGGNSASLPGPLRAPSVSGATAIPPLGEIPVPTERATQPVPDRGPPAIDPEIAALMAQVQPARLAGDVNRLVSFGTRHPLSPTDDADRGVGAARGWLFDAFSSIDGTAGNQVQVSYEDFRMRFAGKTTTQRNVIANLPGIGLSKRFVYVTAHYDSRTTDIEDPEGSAPGADDNASGTAALLELARILAGRKWDSTIRLVAFAANETDLEGSAHHAPEVRRAGLPLLAVFNNDVIGGAKGAEGDEARAVRIFSDGPDDGPSRRLARYAKIVGERYSPLTVEVVPAPDREGREGDHLSFSEEGFAAVRIIEASDDTSRQHSSRDTIDRMDAGYQAEVVRLNLALVANLALAPPAPEEAPHLEALTELEESIEDDASGGADSSSGGGALRVSWRPVEAPFVAGYWVALRKAEESHYSQLHWVGSGTELVLSEIEQDESVVVAVASSDDLGHTSLFSPEATN